MVDWLEEDVATREQAVELLNRAFSDRYHSLAQYVLDAGPHVADADAETLDTIRRIAEYDRAKAEQLADLIESLEGVPQVVAPYPHDIAEFNYLALPYLKKVLAEKLARQADDYEKRFETLNPAPAVTAALADICRDLRAQVEALNR